MVLVSSAATLLPAPFDREGINVPIKPELELPADYVEGELILSPSQIGTWDRCRFKWWLGYDQGWKKIESSYSAALGSMVHNFFAHWYETRDPNVITLVAEQYLASDIADMSTDTLKQLSVAQWVMERYIEWAETEDKVWEVMEVEHHFIYPITTHKGRRFWLQGYIDAVARDLMTGKLWTWDHKTSQSSKMWTPVECMMDPQLPIYSAALKEFEGLDIFGLMHNLVKVYDYKDRSKVSDEQIFRRDKHYRSASELHTIMEQVRMVADEIYDFRQARPTPRRSLDKSCSFCWFQEPCMMSMKGMDINSLMLNDFEKKSSFKPTDTQEETRTQWA